jgi:hypothetical protein
MWPGLRCATARPLPVISAVIATPAAAPMTASPQLKPLVPEVTRTIVGLAAPGG